MSRFEGDFAAAGDSPLSPDELRDLLAACSALPMAQRREAIACYLSASEGWHEALKALRGAFASDAAAAVRAGGAGQDARQDKRAVNQRTSEYLQWPVIKPADTDND